MSRNFETVQKDLARNLKATRLKVGVSQEELAHEANVDRTYVSQIERAIGNPSLHVIIRLAHALDIEIERLITSDNS